MKNAARTDNRYWSRFSLVGLVLVPLVTLWGPETMADDRHYQSWSPAGTDRLQELVDRLTKLVDEADRSRAADRNFILDLRGLVADYDNPWRTEILRDNFLDGDYTSNPRWTLDRGRFWVERGKGLRSNVPAPQVPDQDTAASGGSGSRDLKGRELAIALLGSLLDRSTGEETTQPSTASAATDDQARIHIAREIPNAFSIRVDLWVLSDAGQLNLGPYKQTDTSGGYRLSLTPGGSPVLRLLRVSPGGTALIESVNSLQGLSDGKSHALVWTRSTAGEMRVSLDDKVLMRVTDRSVLSPLKGFKLVNRFGDFAIAGIQINAAANR